MSIHGLTKGTNLEKTMAMMMQAEANGTMMYYALARLAKEQGMDDVAEKFIEAANQEAVHAGFYNVLNGKTPQDFWNLVRALRTGEKAAGPQVRKIAEQARAAGFAEAADEIEVFAKQEEHHGEMMEEILKSAGQPLEVEVPEGKKAYVCPVCGYIHIVDADAKLEDDFTCPICAQPGKIFKEKQ